MNATSTNATTTAFYVSGPFLVNSSTASSTITGTTTLGAAIVQNGFRLSNYANCNLDTDADGYIQCGTDATSAGSQTPWTSDINASGFDLSNVSIITATGSISVATATPAFSSAFAVHGDAFFSGALLNVSNITATGTLTVQGTTASSTFMGAVELQRIGVTAATSTFALAPAYAETGIKIGTLNAVTAGGSAGTTTIASGSGAAGLTNAVGGDAGGFLFAGAVGGNGGMGETTGHAGDGGHGSFVLFQTGFGGTGGDEVSFNDGDGGRGGDFSLVLGNGGDGGSGGGGNDSGGQAGLFNIYLGSGGSGTVSDGVDSQVAIRTSSGHDGAMLAFKNSSAQNMMSFRHSATFDADPRSVVIDYNTNATNTINNSVNSWSVAVTDTGTPILSINGANSRIGIGTTSPGATLGVQGNLLVSGGISGAGLTSCSATSSKLLWNASTSTFNCGTDAAGAAMTVLDTVGGAVHTATATVAFDTVVSGSDTTSFTFTDGSDEIQVNQDGLYQINYTCSITNTSSVRALGGCALFSNVSGSFAQVQGAVCYAYARGTSTAGTEEGSCTGTIIQEMSNGNDIRLGLNSGSGANIITNGGNNGSSLTIKMIGDFGADLAELYNTHDHNLTSGDVVSIDPNLLAGIRKSSNPYDSHVVGIVSSKPGLILGVNEGERTEIQKMVALSGRVPVKVTNLNGAIEPGDFLAPSSIPGVAMKATKAGPIIGQAMEAYDEPDINMILAFVKNDYFTGDVLASLTTDLGEEVATQSLTRKERSKRILSRLMSQQVAFSYTQDDVSEVFTDQLVAGVEVVTPQITTEQLFVDTIQSFSGGDLNLVLSDNGQLVIRGSALPNALDKTPSEAVITFDSSGNAFFAGEVTADSINAHTIRGLDVITDRISVLSGELENLATRDDAAFANLSVLEQLKTKTLRVHDVADFTGSVQFGSTTQFLDLATFAQGVTVGQDVIIQGSLSVGHTAEFLQSVSFLDTVTVDGGLSIGSLPDGERAIVFDGGGNALLSGTVQAYKLIADEIETPGLIVLEERIATLEDFVTDILSRLEVLESQSGLDLETVLTLRNGLDVHGETRFHDGLRVDHIGALGDRVRFIGDVEFGRPYFNHDTAGFAIVRAGERSVAVTFTEEYLAQPVVTATIALETQDNVEDLATLEEAIFQNDVRYLVTKKDVRGFSILLNKPVPFDIGFSWVALAVQDANIFINSDAVISPPPPVSDPEPIPDPLTEDLEPDPPVGGELEPALESESDPVVDEESDVVLPVITLLGDSEVEMIVGEVYFDAGARAEDDIDGDITADIVTESTVDTALLGTYAVTYNVVDTAGNVADEVVRTVTVLEPLPDSSSDEDPQPDVDPEPDPSPPAENKQESEPEPEPAPDVLPDEASDS
ncbi:MAG: hypothetical protein COU08_00775 [Candidatus Harrisonbacteria bacterium CG10_big_fil_rev_8_21_14_0_10_42_17]|uniref:Pesticidal crystal protein Cry22Aa Ig-like domain-containing protein n=1 Tax=Candidatus Harrisonbacteria bacterium CG10_big_fil_rev_8_21_14_0_10_42_17 TaxID=1974584 RepID=A0A2M6WJ22_9BACT|nr:MAG: hypothetical protein COU08_00775 [Candidatus Harrisonbacteria bacterium CG10_big_fil_rev_8_21_14_0_10_42_17]